MAGAWQTGEPLSGPFTPYKYQEHGQAKMYHWAPQPSGGYPAGGAGGILFLHGGNFTGGNASQTFLVIFTVGLLTGESDTFPLHYFSLDVRQARQVFNQAQFSRRKYPTYPSDVNDSRDDCIDALHFLHENAAALNLNPNYLAIASNSAGGPIITAAAYHPDAGMTAGTGRRFDRRAEGGVRPAIIFTQNCPYIPRYLKGSTNIDNMLLSSIYASDATDRDNRWASMLTQIQEISPDEMARKAFEHEGYAPPVLSAYDNNDFDSTPNNFTITSPHTAVTGYWFHRMLQDEFGYDDADHWLGFTGSVPGGATEPWAQNVWDATVPGAQDSWDWLKSKFQALGYNPNP